VIFEQLAHQAVDRSARRREPLQHVGALLVLVQRAQDAFELPDHLLGPRNQIQLFSR
jgi:hypothetical protein